ncbi:glycosyltransferase family 2 protein [Cellulomonas sp. KH9]|uniref:glycosyltransferase family 2 protein n=1 Tax=Cellulomonas sp. KH9 TaxID=1855324 RepID=UPI0008F181CD|nr:Glycosyltransferase, GT2 family [Cellulomonas sp. KH9]
MTRIAVLIVNFRSAAHVANLLADLSAQPASGQLIVSIVDNSLDEDERLRLERMAEAHSGTFRLIRVTAAADNLGYAGGNNLAYRSVEAEQFDFVSVVNPDVRILAGSVVQLSQACTSSSWAIAVPETSHAGSVSDGRAAIDRFSGRTRQMSRAEAPGSRWIVYPAGHFLMMNRDLWVRSEGLSEDYFLYAEEVDLVLRLGDRAEIVPSDSLLVAHSVGASTGSSEHGKSQVTLYHAARSKVVLFQRHASLRPYVPLLVVARLAFAVVNGRQGWAAARGVLAGLRYRPSGPTRLTSPTGK